MQDCTTVTVEADYDGEEPPGNGDDPSGPSVPGDDESWLDARTVAIGIGVLGVLSALGGSGDGGDE